jgi:acetaldehyde dehydrogenase (acetylating)
VRSVVGVDCQSEGLASHVTVTATAHYVVMEINLPDFSFSPILCFTTRHAKLSSYVAR